MNTDIEANALNQVKAHFKQSAELKMRSMESLSPHLVATAFKIIDCIKNKGKILAIGNGGSAADAQHFSAEMLNRFERERNPLPAIALTTDSSTITSIGNDYDYNQIFSKQIEALGARGDLLLAISTSGNSPNILTGIQAAHAGGMNIIALTGNGGGKITTNLRENDLHLCVPAKRTARIQEIHILCIHCICDIVDSYK